MVFLNQNQLIMEKIFIACMVPVLPLLITTAFFESFESFKRRSLHFLLFLNRKDTFESIFVHGNQSVNTYIKSRQGMMAQMISSFLNSRTRRLLQEVEGFEIEKCAFEKKREYELTVRALGSRNAKIAELHTALGSPQL
jgi:hypothetical protein